MDDREGYLYYRQDASDTGSNYRSAIAAGNTNGIKNDVTSRLSESSATENDHYYQHTTKIESNQDSPPGMFTGEYNNPKRHQDSPTEQHTPPVKKGRGRPKKICDGVEIKEWSDEEIYKLIELWGTHDILYNCKHPLYHNKSEKAKAMERLRENLEEAGIPVTTRQIFDKLTTLRNYYGAVKRKSESLKRQGFEGEEAYFCRWQFYQPLAFLDGTFSPRHSDLHLKKHPYIIDNTPMTSSVRTMSSLLTLTNQQGRPVSRDSFDRPMEPIQANHMIRPLHNPIHNPIHANHTHPVTHPVSNSIQPHHVITSQSNHTNESNHPNPSNTTNESAHTNHSNHANERSTPNQSNHPHQPSHPLHPNHPPTQAKLTNAPNHTTQGRHNNLLNHSNLPNHHNHARHNPHSDKTEDQLFGEMVAKMISGIIDSEEKALLLIRIQQDIVQTKFRAKSAFQKPRTTPWTANQETNPTQTRETNNNQEYYTEQKANTNEYYTEQKTYHSNSSIQHSSLEHSPLSSRSDSPLSSPACPPKLDITS